MATDFILREVPDRERRRKTVLAGALTLISGFFAAAAVPHIDSSGFLWVLYAGYMALCVAYTYRSWTTRYVREPSPEVKAEEKAREAEAQRKQHEVEGKWYFRYPMSAVMAGCGIYLISEREQLWWVGAILCLLALLQAWEMLLLALLIGVVYLIFQGIAALPLSVAVVVGAIIIASSLGRRRN